jgi:hypothetical protein
MTGEQQGPTNIQKLIAWLILMMGSWALLYLGGVMVVLTIKGWIWLWRYLG